MDVRSSSRTDCTGEVHASKAAVVSLPCSDRGIDRRGGVKQVLQLEVVARAH